MTSLPPEPEPVSSAGQKMAMPSPLKSPAMESVKIHDLIRIGSLDELVTSFVFTTDPEHTDLVTEPEEVVTRSVQVSAAIQEKLSQIMSSTHAKVVAKSVSYMKISTGVDGDSEPQETAVEGRIKMAVSDAAMEIAEAQLLSVLPEWLDSVLIHPGFVSSRRL